jgi:tetratricopeptide (TPR) repeat protein
VCQELADSPALVLVTYREDALAEDDPRLGRLADLARQPGALQVSPTRLDEDAVRRYATATIAPDLPQGLVESIHRLTAGNPLFVTELVRLIVEEHQLDLVDPLAATWIEVPAGLRAVIGRRLAGLTPGARTMLEHAAVIGGSVPLDQLMMQGGATLEETLTLLDEVVRAGVLITAGQPQATWLFKHPLVREVIYAGIPTAHRLQLHLACATALETLHGDDREGPLALLAHHFVAAAPLGGAAHAIDYSRRAARRATEAAAHEEAVRHLRNALEFATDPDPARVALLIELGDAATRAGDGDTARAAHLEAAGIAEKLGLVDDFARAAIGYGGRFVWVRAGSDRALVPLLERALEAVGEQDSGLRVRLLARLAGALRSQRDVQRRDALSAEALRVARRLADPILLHLALISRYWSIAGPDAIDALPAIVEETTELTHAIRDRERMTDAHIQRFDFLATIGDEMTSLRREVDAYGELAGELRQPSLRWYHLVLDTVLAIDEGRLEEAERLSDAAYEIGVRSYPRDARMSRLLSLFAIRREQGRIPDIADEIRQAVREFPDYPFLAAVGAYVDAVTGQLEAAVAALDRLTGNGSSSIPRDMSWLVTMSYVGEAAVLARYEACALAVERELLPFARFTSKATAEVGAGPVSRVLGSVAAMAGRHDDALGHLTTAIALCRQAGLRAFELRSQLEMARVLMARGGEGDTSRALELAAAVLRDARASALAATADDAVGMLRSVAVPESPERPTTARPTLFVREGDTWRIGADRVYRLRHSKGLAYLARLLAEPGREYHVLDLARLEAGGAEPAAPSFGMSAISGAIPGAGIDSEARRAYRSRVAELRTTLSEAEATGDAIVAERSRSELDALERELATAYGLGGRKRPEGSAKERAGQSVTKAIRATISRISAEDSLLGAHLARSIRTGTYCSYDPDPSSIRHWLVTWQVRRGVRPDPSPVGDPGPDARRSYDPL